jgi:hypothetical protein
MSRRGSPPAETRFRKGQSGNPNGRPRKKPPQPASSFDVLIDKTLTIVQDGLPAEVSVEEALHHKTYHNALAGDRAAQREVLRWIAIRDEALAPLQKKHQEISIKRDPADPRNADDALLHLGIATLNPDRRGIPEGKRALLLEPWAVEAALRRRRGGPLTDQDIRSVRFHTRDPDSVRWPRR